MKAAYTAAELAGLPGMPDTARSVQKRAVGEGWPYYEMPTRGGRQRLYPADRLPEAVRLAIAAAAQPKLPAVREKAAPDPTRLAGWQRERAYARVCLLHEAERLAGEEAGTISAGIEALAEQARTGRLPQHLAELVPVANARVGVQERTLSVTTLWRWRAQLQEGGFAALAPAEARAGERVPAWAPTFIQLHQTPQKRALAAVVKDLCSALPEDVAPPSVAQVRRWYRKLSAVERGRGRLGSNALKSVCAFIRRDTSLLLPTDVFVSDGHTFDAEVAHPRNGRPFRPELTCVIDWKTRMLVGWSAALAESTWAVADALRHAVESHGIPAVYYADHGPGQENRVMRNLLGRLCIQEARSLPRNSQARGVIERFNQYLIAEAKRLPTYMGADMDKDAANRVYKLSRRELRLVGTSRLLMPWPEFLAFIGQAIDAYNRGHNHRSLPKTVDPVDGRTRHMTPAEAWQAALDRGWEPMRVGAAEAADLFRPYELRRVRRGEIDLFGHRYFCRDLEHLTGDEVMVGYDIHDPSRVWVRNLDDHLVAIAELDANSRPAFPQSVIEQAREERARGRLKRLETHSAEVRAELHGPAPAIDYDAGWTPEQQAALEQRNARREPPEAGIDESGDDLRYARARQLETAIAAGEAVDDDDRAWLEHARKRPWYLARSRLDEIRASRAG
jgi:putative transposase